MIAGRKLVAVLFIAAVWLVPSGCSFVLPKTSGLEQVHDLYTEEFAQLMVPGPAGEDAVRRADAGGNAAAQSSPFSRTLAAIRKFRAEYGDSREAAHLLVLKGMVYLQSGQPGLARLLIDEIEGVRGQLVSGTGSETRDSLFAANYRDLVTGWAEIWDEFDGKSETETERKKLEAAADRIKARLENVNPSRIAKPTVDQGGVYVATSAAIFWMWAYKIGRETRDPDAAPGSAPPYAGDFAVRRKEFAGRGADLIGRFLAAEERELVDNGGSMREFAAVDGRLRFVEWYAALRQLAK